MRKVLSGLFLILGCLLLLSSCAAIRPQAPQIQLAGLTISDLTLSHANFLATLNVYNPNDSTIDIDGLDFSLYLNDVNVARGATAKAFSVPAEQSGSAALRLSTSFLDLFRLSQKLKGLDQVPFRIAGEVKIGGPGFLWMTVPIDSSGTIPLAGTLDQLIFAPDEFWRRPQRLSP
jgi:LEA14-like dessication related protein